MNRYENHGISRDTFKELMSNFENELFNTGYDINLKDPDTITELRRCRCKDIKLLCQVGPLNPSNPLYDNHNKCLTTFGGKCGLYTCICREDEDEWFKGFCSYCEEPIQDKFNAKRIPLAAGGFKGCFCSNSCAHECLSENTAAIEHVLIEIMQEYQNIIDTYYLEESIKDKNFSLESLLPKHIENQEMTISQEDHIDENIEAEPIEIVVEILNDF